MIKTLRNIFRQDKERFVVPKGVQDVIPITAIYDDGIFRVGKDKFTKTFKFTDIIVNAKNDFNFPNQQFRAFWINNHPKSKY